MKTRLQVGEKIRVGGDALFFEAPLGALKKELGASTPLGTAPSRTAWSNLEATMLLLS